MKKIVFGAGLLLAATAAGAQLAPPAAQPAPRGSMVAPVQTRGEAVERVRAMFAQADANRDGFITQDEQRAARGMKGQRMKAQRMARQADPARRAQMFDRLDTNRDNVISRDEWSRVEAIRGERGAEGRRGAMRGERLAMRGRMGAAMLRAADADRDGRISLAEAQAAAVQRFDRLDLNRDGRVTPDERAQARQQRQLNRPAPQPVR